MKSKPYSLMGRLLTGLLIFATASALAQLERPTLEQIQGKVTIRRPCKINEETTVRLPIGEAVQFDCADNPFALKCYLVYPAGEIVLAKKSEPMWLCLVDAEGDLMDLRANTLREVKGSLQQVMDTPCLAILKWEIAERTVQLRFCLSTDQGRNQREADLASARKVRLASGGRNLKPYQPSKLPEAERLAQFARLWSEVKFNFVSFDHVPDLNWDQVLVDYLPEVQKAETREDYFCVLAHCLAQLHDGHTDIQYRGGERPHPDRGAYSLPIEVRPLGGKRAVIVRLMAAADIPGPGRREEFTKANFKPSEELTHINGRAVQEMLEQDIYPYICASTPQSRDLRAYSWLLLGEYGSKARLRIRGLDGSEREVVLTRAPYDMKEPRNAFECRDLPDGLLYVNLHSFGSKDIVKSFEGVFPRVQKAKGLILDVRRNGGGSSSYGDAIISMFIDKPIAGRRWKTRKYLPAFRAWGRKEEWHEKEGDPVQPTRKDPYLGPIVLLTGPRTFSAAEDFAVVLHAAKRATLVGERTGGSTGQPLILEMPGGATARICTKRDTYPDGREFVGVGVIPDVEVQLTATDIATDRDMVLETAIQRLVASR